MLLGTQGVAACFSPLCCIVPDASCDVCTNYRLCSSSGAPLLAPLNQALIRDDDHRNPMDVGQLDARLSSWLQGDYQAVLFEDGEQPAGYALFRQKVEFVMLRQFFVVPARRRKGVGRNAFALLWASVWAGAPALRVEVLVGNATGRAFWQAVGFEEYFVTMEMRAQGL